MIPLNSHVQIEPETNNEFVASMKQTYDEVGVVVAVAEGITVIKAGDRVFFDSWQASKFPKDTHGNYFWYVPFESIKAYEQIPEKRM